MELFDSQVTLVELFEQSRNRIQSAMVPISVPHHTPFSSLLRKAFKRLTHIVC